ncbi:flagellar hook-associated protein FlgK [Rubrivirga sp.]|uniref:flagellar hook-associated protein FlgK n=1 Tax=Rubrivirga sp. TaxID=1885344 RepID=UPI003B518667
MSLTRLFSTARQSLLANQAAINATGLNIANAETPGYTRRTVGLRATPAARGGVFIRSGPSPGGGVQVGSFDRVRNGILDGAVRRGRAGSGGANEGALLLSGLESQLAADGGDAFLGALGGFFDAWGDVADAPADLSVRDTLLSKAGQLAQTLNGAASRLQSYGASVQTDLKATVEQTNALLAEVADLNVAIRTAQAQGSSDLDALDRRDVVLDELAGLAPFALQDQPDGSVTVTLDGMMAVQDDEVLPLRLALPPDVAAPQIRAQGSDRSLRLGALDGGALGAQLDLLGTALPGARAALDGLAADLVAAVNAAHAGGTGLDGSTGQPFFDPAGVTAGTISLAPGLTAESVAAGTTGPGDASVATLIAGLSEETSTAATRLLANLGSGARKASTAAGANGAVAAHAEALRDGVSRVSLDEEMTNLIRFQQTYAASARVLETADSLFDTLLAI